MSAALSYGYNSILVALLALIVACNTDRSKVVAWVNQHPISRSEFEHWMLLERAEVHNYFYKTYNEADSEDFWEKEIDGESPLEMLKERAFEKAVRCKVQQIIALEKGLVKHIDFDQMMEEMKAENLERNNKIERGEVVYGAKSYTRRSYFAHEFDLLTIHLKSELAKDELKASENALQALEKNEDFPLEENLGFYQLQYVEQHFDPFIDSLTAAAEIHLNKRNWRSIHIFF